MIINISDIWERAIPQHHAYLKKRIEDHLNKLSCSFIDKSLKNFIEDNKRIIICGSPSQLNDCIKDYKRRFGNRFLHERVKQKLKKIFNYESFSIKSDRKWTAFKLCSLTKYNVCCYCNMIPVDTSPATEKVKGYRPPLDHYYAKSEYPFLALTLANLIPCCEKCNGSQMKHDTDFEKTPHLNPMSDVESIEFELRPLVNDDDIAKALTLQLPRDKYALIVEAKLNVDKAQKSIITFQLESRYSHYTSQSYSLARKARVFAARKPMLDEKLDFEVELSDILEFEPDQYKNTVYGKARICIAKQFGAIKI